MQLKTIDLISLQRCFHYFLISSFITCPWHTRLLIPEPLFSQEQGFIMAGLPV
jgi:hypothetical protein